METVAVEQQHRASEPRGKDSIITRLNHLVADSTKRSAVSGTLRALTRPLLGALTTMRYETIEPYERALGYASLRLSADIDEDTAPVTEDPRYLLGRVEALLDICDMGIDRSVSGITVRQAGARKYVPEILAQLVANKDMSLAEIGKATGIHTKQQRTNVLTWMEGHDLVRRVTAGRYTLVSLGPKGEAVHLALTESPRLPSKGRQRNVALVRQMAEKGELSTWLLQGFSEDRFEPVLLEPATSPVESIAALFQELAATDRGRFRKAVAGAVGQWRYPAEPYQSIQALAELGLSVGATDVVGMLRGHVEQDRIDHKTPEGRRTLAALATILGRFRGVEPAHDTLRRLYLDKRFPSELTADIFVELCRSKPSSYPLHLPRFLDAIEHDATRREPEFHQSNAEHFIAVTGWDTIGAHAHELSREPLLRLVHLIGWERVIMGVEDVPSDTLEAFLIRGLTWRVVAEELLNLDDKLREKLLRLLCRRPDPLGRMIWRDCLPVFERLKPAGDRDAYVDGLLQDALITLTWYKNFEETRALEEIYSSTH